MACSVRHSQPLFIRVREDQIVVTSSQLPDGVQQMGVDDLWGFQECLAGTHPDLVVLDLMLPITVGADLLKLIFETMPDVDVITQIDSLSSEPHVFLVEPTVDGLSMRPPPGPPPEIP